MANEINVSASIRARKSGAQVSRGESIRVTMTGDSMHHGVTSIATGGTALEHAEAAAEGTVGYVWVKNLDSTNFVTLGTHSSSNHTVKLLAGEIAIFRAAGDLFGVADTSACIVEWVSIEL